MEVVYLGLGSNVGNRQEYLKKAIQLLDASPSILIEQQAHFYQTSPVGGIVQDDFINTALKISTTLDAKQLLEIIHQIEAKLHRVRQVHWGPRTIDIDILFYGEQSQVAKELTLPHPEVFHRLFVLVPLNEIISSDFLYYTKVQESIARLEKSDQKVQKVSLGGRLEETAKRTEI